MSESEIMPDQETMQLLVTAIEKHGLDKVNKHLQGLLNCLEPTELKRFSPMAQAEYFRLHMQSRRNAGKRTDENV